jgi:SAM-dependent methyltransferase
MSAIVDASTKTNRYSRSWYQTFACASGDSASEIVPLLVELFDVRSVVDLGCGLGVWLRTFLEAGAEEVLGVDGDHVVAEDLVINQKDFLRHDLNKPFHVPRTFDLAICLEVAEHLPETAAEPLVESLTSMSARVLFSAAVPGQGGTHHINEQWLQYWYELFRFRGFELIDAIRPQIWNNNRVDFWYAQNAVLFVNQQEFFNNAKLAPWANGRRCLSMIHPRLFTRTRAELEATLDYRIRKFARRLRARSQRLVLGQSGGNP